uniref:Uncharacterized protein n=1 Tax=Anopheles dirus TaxID=7168 RepID=A0A182NYI0_9DIPT
MKLSFFLAIFGAILLFLNVADASPEAKKPHTPGTPRVPKTHHTKGTKKSAA